MLNMKILAEFIVATLFKLMHCEILTYKLMPENLSLLQGPSGSGKSTFLNVAGVIR